MAGGGEGGGGEGGGVLRGRRARAQRGRALTPQPEARGGRRASSNVNGNKIAKKRSAGAISFVIRTFEAVRSCEVHTQLRRRRAAARCRTRVPSRRVATPHPSQGAFWGRLYVNPTRLINSACALFFKADWAGGYFDARLALLWARKRGRNAYHHQGGSFAPTVGSIPCSVWPNYEQNSLGVVQPLWRPPPPSQASSRARPGLKMMGQHRQWMDPYFATWAWGLCC